MDAFMRQLTKNIEYNLSELFIEKHLYNFIRDFLYSSTKLLYAPKINHLKITVELPIIGSNYMVLCNEPTLIQYDNNIFSETTTKKQEYIFEIIGDYESIDYTNYKYKSYVHPDNIFWRKLNACMLKKIIDYGTNPELRIIDISMCKKMDTLQVLCIPMIEKFVWNKYTFSYGENITGV